MQKETNRITRILLLVCAAVATAMLCACAPPPPVQWSNTQCLPETLLKASDDWTYASMNETFMTDYGLSSMTSHRVSLLDDDESTLLAEFEFSADAPRWEIDAARGYARNVFLFQKWGKLATDVYQSQMMGLLGENAMPNRVVIHVIVDGELLLQEIYNREDLSSEHFYEDMTPQLPARATPSVTDERAQAFLAAAENTLPGGEVYLQKSLQGDALVVQVASRAPISAYRFAKLKESAAQAFDRASDEYAQPLYAVLAMELYAQGERYAMEWQAWGETEWRTHDWLNYRP